MALFQKMKKMKRTSSIDMSLFRDIVSNEENSPVGPLQDSYLCNSPIVESNEIKISDIVVTNGIDVPECDKCNEHLYKFSDFDFNLYGIREEIVTHPNESFEETECVVTVCY